MKKIFSQYITYVVIAVLCFLMPINTVVKVILCLLSSLIAFVLYSHKKHLKEEAKKQEDKDRLIRKYGESDGTKIYNKEIWIGMTEDMLFDSYGKPGTIANSTGVNKVRNKYYFQPYTNAKNNISYRKEVTVENQKIVSFKDL